MSEKNDDITPEKVLFGFVLMASAGRTGVTGPDIAYSVSNLQSECIASLLADDSGQARERMTEKLRTLWAVYEEHDPHDNPWDLPGS